MGITDGDQSRHGGRSAGAAELPVYLADVRGRERAGVGAPPCPGGALGEADRLCTARTEYSTSDVILRTRGMPATTPTRATTR